MWFGCIRKKRWKKSPEAKLLLQELIMKRSTAKWLTEVVAFPKTGYALAFYLLHPRTRLYVLGEGWYTDMAQIYSLIPDLIHQATAEKSQIKHFVVIPLIFESLHENQLDYWDAGASVFDDIFSKFQGVVEAIENPETSRAVVTCAYLNRDGSANFTPAGFFDVNESETLVSSIKRSKSPADQRVKHSGIYQVVKPIMIDAQSHSQAN